MPDRDLCPNVQIVHQNYTETVIKTVSNYTGIAITIISCLIIMIIVFALAIVYYYRKKLQLLSFFYVHCNGCYSVFFRDPGVDEENKQFDAFISYGSEDRQVAFEIMRELEGNPPNYKICIHDRNWLAGFFIIDNIAYSVQNSRKTLIVVSDAFIRSRWFDAEFRAAFHQSLQDKRDRLVVILKGKLPEGVELHKDVRFNLATRTYLEWGEKWFWEKLRFAMQEPRTLGGRRPKCKCTGNLFGWFRRRRTHNTPEQIEL